jgi:ABC-type phosphate transport system ATPase subunit
LVPADPALRGELGRREENRKTNVRAELTSFVGRDADVAAVRELISEHRLTTLIGPGGSGKTRAESQRERHADDVRRRPLSTWSAR